MGVFQDTLSSFAAYLHDSTSAVLVVGTFPGLEINLGHLQSLVDSRPSVFPVSKGNLKYTEQFEIHVNVCIY